VKFEDSMAVRIPTRAFIAYIDKGLLPFAGGITDQPYAYWRFIEEMAAGYRNETNARQRAENERIASLMRQRR
jgi:hypothetical protein